jgi:thioredoxin-dependent peroxiredoxin
MHADDCHGLGVDAIREQSGAFPLDLPGLIRCDASMKSLSLSLFAALITATAAFAGQGAKVEPYAAPDVESIDQEGKAVKLAEIYKANPFVVVYFYPKADTGGCTKQGCSLRDALPDLSKLGVKVIGVSADSVEAQKKFADKNSFGFTLLADTEAKVIDAFKVEKNAAGMATRQAFLIKDGKVVWHDAKASTDKQAEDIKKAIDEVK